MDSETAGLAGLAGEPVSMLAGQIDAKHKTPNHAKTNRANSASTVAAYRARGAAQQQNRTPNRATPPSLARLCRLCGGRAPAAPELGACEARCFAPRNARLSGARSCLCATRWPAGSGPSGVSLRRELLVRIYNGAAKYGGPAERRRGAGASREMACTTGAECEDRRACVGRLGARRWQVSCGGVGWIPGSGAADMTAAHYSTSKE